MPVLKERGCTEGEVRREKVRGRWRETDTQTERESGWGRNVERVGERETDEPCIVSASLAPEET